MAEGWARGPLLCTICLDVLKSPATLQCGHNYCMDCMNAYWDTEDQRGVYTCPQCRQTFKPRPVLNKNTMLADLMGKMPTHPPAAGDEVAAGDVACDFCTQKKLKAVKSCLVCLASYCATHLQPHHESAAFKRHKLVEVSSSIQERICSKHDKLIEIYCRTDGQCICLLCVMDAHKGHDTISAAAERNERQRQLGKKKQRYQQGMQEKEEQLQHLKHKMKALKHIADAAADQNEKAFADLVQMANKSRRAVKETISVQEKAAMSRAEALVDRLEKDIMKLRVDEDKLKQLSQTDDNINFIQSCQFIFDHTESAVSSDRNIHLHTSFDFVTKGISDLTHKMKPIVAAIADLTIETDPDPKTRQEFLLYSCHPSLDPNTEFENIMLSEGNSKITWVKKAQHYPHHPERFTTYDQVLCTEGLSGVCYWEVECRGPKVEVAVCYKGEKLQESCFGYTDQSWCISIASLIGCTFWHNGVKTRVSGNCPSTVGVYLNHKAGTLSFYSVRNAVEMILLHRVHTTFSEPLYPGFMVGRGASVRILTSK